MRGYVEQDPRQIVALYSDTWMLYDRYGQCKFNEGARASAVSLDGPSGATANHTASVEDDGAVPGPVPNTRYKRGKDPKAITEEDETELTPDALRYYDELIEKRRGLADDVKAGVGECEFQLRDSLRLTWVPAQRADRTLSHFFALRDIPDGYRLAPDGLLERLVLLPPPAGPSWVPIVPGSQTTGNLTWKRLLFLQCHVGILGAHCDAEKTHMLLKRQVWWSTMRADVAE